MTLCCQTFSNLRSEKQTDVSLPLEALGSTSEFQKILVTFFGSKVNFLDMLFRNSFSSKLCKFMLNNRVLPGLKVARGYSDDKGLQNPCEKKQSGGDNKCVDDHPKARTREEVMKEFPFYGLIKFSDDLCCNMDCPDKAFPNFDECLYKESDKNKRKYQITWTECPKVAIQPKKICCFKNVTKPPIERRPPKFKPDTACKIEKQCVDEDSPCPKINLPGCRPGRNPPKCDTVRTVTNCTKIKVPYPAFSECSRAKLRLPKRTECTCLDEIMGCILLQQKIKREKAGKRGFSPCDKN